MIRLDDDLLTISLPEVHPDARLKIDFQRTLRIPDDDRDHSLPPGLGRFPLRLVDDYASDVPDSWIEHGGVMLPMYQSEALWINFNGRYPFAVKVAAGKINAVTGDPWSDRLHQHPQDYMVTPMQPWLDGFAVEEGVIRQFVAMPLGSGYSAEEQITGEAEFGGLQIVVYPMKRELWESLSDMSMVGDAYEDTGAVLYSMAAPDMGLAPGGRMRQQIFDDTFSFDAWDRDHSARCFVHLTNSLVWRQITGDYPPTVPPTAKQYTKAGLPWFDYWEDEAPTHPGSDRLGKLKSVLGLAKEKGDNPLPENESVAPKRVIELRRGLEPGQVREGRL